MLGVLLAASGASFWLGFLSGLEEVGQRTGDPTPEVSVETGAPLAATTTGKYVASQNGTKYYLPTCAGAARISEANKIWFASAEDAQSAGYSPAANCKGL